MTSRARLTVAAAAVAAWALVPVGPAAAAELGTTPVASLEVVAAAAPIEVCDIFIVVCAVLGEASDAARDLAGEVGGALLAPLADAVAGAVTEIIKSGLTWWMDQPTIRVSEAGAWGTLSPPVLGVSALIAMLLLVVQAIRTMVSRRGASLLQAGEGLLVWAALAAVSVALVDLLARMSDALTEQIRSAAFDGGTEGMAGRISDMVLVAPGSPALLLLLGLLGFLVGVVHMFVMFFRQVAIPIQTLLLPLAAAGQVGQGSSRAWLGRLWASILAVLAYKPMAMLIIGVGFSEAGTGADLVDAIRGLATLVLSVLALPLLLHLFSPILAAGVNAGGGMGAANTAVWGWYMLSGGRRAGSTPTGADTAAAAIHAGATTGTTGAAAPVPTPVAQSAMTTAAPAAGPAAPAVSVAVVAAEAAATAAREAAAHAAGERP